MALPAEIDFRKVRDRGHRRGRVYLVNFALKGKVAICHGPEKKTVSKSRFLLASQPFSITWSTAVCRERRTSSVGAIPTRHLVAPADSNRSGSQGNKTVEDFDERVASGGSANMLAVTQVNAV